MVTFAVPDSPLGSDGDDNDDDIVMTSPPQSPDPPTSTSFSVPSSPSPFVPQHHSASRRWWGINRIWGSVASLVAGVARQVHTSEDHPNNDSVDVLSSGDHARAFPPCETPAPKQEPTDPSPLRELVEDGYALGRVYVGVGGRPRLPIDIKLGKRVRFADDNGLDTNPQPPKRRRKSREVKKEFGIKTGLLRGPRPPDRTAYQGPSMAYLAGKDAALDAILDAPLAGTCYGHPAPDVVRANGASHAQRCGSVGAYSRLDEVLGDLPVMFDDDEREDEFSRTASVLATRRAERQKAEMEAASNQETKERRARNEMARRRTIITNNPLPLATMFDAAIAQCSPKPATPRRSDLSPSPIRPEFTLCTPTSPPPTGDSADASFPDKGAAFSCSVMPPPGAVLNPPVKHNLSPESLPAESDSEPASPASPSPIPACRSSPNRLNQMATLTAQTPAFSKYPGHEIASAFGYAATGKTFTNALLLEPPTQIDDESTIIYQSIEMTTDAEATELLEDTAQYKAKRTRKRSHPQTKEGIGGKENGGASKRARRSLGRASPSKVSPSRASPTRASGRSQRSTKSPEADRKMSFLAQPPRRSRRLTPVVR